MMRSHTGQPESALFKKQRSLLNNRLDILGPTPLGSSANQTVSETDKRIVALIAENRDIFTLKDKNDSPIPHGTSYLHATYARELKTYVSQCHSSEAFNALLNNVYDKDNLFADQQESLLRQIQTQAADSQTKIENIRCLIEITRIRFTLIEFIYYYRIKNTEDSTRLLQLTKSYKSGMMSAMKPLYLIKSDEKTMLSHNPESLEKYISLWRVLFPIYASLRHSKMLSQVKEINSDCSEIDEAPIFLDTLSTSYNVGYITPLPSKTTFSSIHDMINFNPLNPPFNFTYFQQIVGEHLQSLLTALRKMKKNGQKVSSFKLLFLFQETHHQMATVSFLIEDNLLSLQHLEKSLSYTTQALDILLDNEEIPHQVSIHFNKKQ